MSKLLDSILSDSNIALATKQVKANKGSGGIDNITIEQIDEYMLNNWNNIKQQIQEEHTNPHPLEEWKFLNLMEVCVILVSQPLSIELSNKQLLKY